jgi:hypothetical protein
MRTLENLTLAQALQGTGLVSSLAGIVATLIGGLVYAPVWVPVGLAGAALDVYAIRTTSEVRAMLAAGLKLAICLAGLSVAFNTATTAGGLIPADLGPALVLLSALPSTAGAMRKGREW